MSVFLLAADNNQSSVVDVLVEAGADVESKDIHQWTPLHCAARYLLHRRPSSNPTLRNLNN